LTERYTFSSESRLRKSEDFLKIFSARRIRLQGMGFTVWAYPTPKSTAKLGISLSKKKIPKAVHRNHVRRLVRENFRVNQETLLGYEVIVQVHRWDAVTVHKEFSQRLENCWSRLQTEFNSALAQ